MATRIRFFCNRLVSQQKPQPLQKPQPKLPASITPITVPISNWATSLTATTTGNRFARGFHKSCSILFRNGTAFGSILSLKSGERLSVQVRRFVLFMVTGNGETGRSRFGSFAGFMSSIGWAQIVQCFYLNEPRSGSCHTRFYCLERALEHHLYR